MGIIKAAISSVSELIQNKQLNIPNFQRPYKWSVKNVVQLLEDIDRFKKQASYRIGTVVLHQDAFGDHIVDGQQRTVTFLLIIRALSQLVASPMLSVKLLADVQHVAENTFQPKFRHPVSKSNIQENYREISRRVVHFDNDFIDFFLNRCEVTYIVIDDVSEAFQFFDSQNSRGKDLEPHDLLKAYHLRELQSTSKVLSESAVADLVDAWEEMDTHALASLFSDFLYRVRGWSKGNSSRYFLKKDVSLFKGINLDKIKKYPHVEIYRLVDQYLNDAGNEIENKNFPFQLDQTILNGEYFFKMISHYKEVFDKIKNRYVVLEPVAKLIMETLDHYGGKNRTGDLYIRMIFNCALLYYTDKFGFENISKAIEKLFIWAYTPRLSYQSLQFASVDNYVVREYNVFKMIKEAIYSEDIIRMELPGVIKGHISDKTAEIRELFIKMRYYEN